MTFFFSILANVSTFVLSITIIVVLLNWLKRFCQVKSNKVQVFCCHLAVTTALQPLSTSESCENMLISVTALHIFTHDWVKNTLCPMLHVVNCWQRTAFHTSLLDHINEPYLFMLITLIFVTCDCPDKPHLQTQPNILHDSIFSGGV